MAEHDSFFIDSTMTDTGCLTIRVTGYLDADSAEEFSATLGRYLGIKSWVVELSGCDFLDSSGIRALLMCRAEIGPSAPMALVGVRPHIERTLRLTGVDELFEIYADTDGPDWEHADEAVDGEHAKLSPAARLLRLAGDD